MAGLESHEAAPKKTATDFMAEAFEGIDASEANESNEATGKKAQAEAQNIHDKVMTHSSSLEEASAKVNEACRQIANHLNSKSEYKGKDFDIRIQSGWGAENQFNLYGHYNSEVRKWEMTNYGAAPFPPS